MDYRHVQPGTWVMLLLLAPAVLVLAISLQSGHWWLLLGVPLFAGAAWVFRRLVVEVDGPSGVLSVAFGSGWPRRELPLAEVRSAERVRNRWYYGWGIRLTPGGWMFNISGLDAVHVELEGGRSFRIGTDDPDGLLRSIRECRGPAVGTDT